MDHNGASGPRQCTNGTTPNSSSSRLTLEDRLRARVRGVGSEGGLSCPCACGPCGSWVHYADSLDGPFQQLAVPFNTKNKTSEGTGFVMDNPAPYIFENGTVLVLFRKINWCVTSNPPTCSRATRALTEIWLARAPSFRGPYEIIGDEPGKKPHIFCCATLH